MEALNFTAFMFLSFSSHWIADLWDKWQAKHRPNLLPVSHHRRAVVITAVSSVVSQPSFWHGVKDYLIHFVVYSGIVLPTH